MQLHVLASGSSGNAIFIELGGARILVDAGISARRIDRSLMPFTSERCLYGFSVPQ